jgi:hypothetical protein
MWMGAKLIKATVLIHLVNIEKVTYVDGRQGN